MLIYYFVKKLRRASSCANNIKKRVLLFEGWWWKLLNFYKNTLNEKKLVFLLPSSCLLIQICINFNLIEPINKIYIKLANLVEKWFSLLFEFEILESAMCNEIESEKFLRSFAARCGHINSLSRKRIED